MTEEKARTKWCPYIRVNGRNRDYTRTPPDKEKFRCIASDCMMWRDNGVGDNTGFCGLGGDIGRI